MSAKQEKSNIDYQALKKELDEILYQLQNEDVDIEVAISKYERGQVILMQLQKFLDEAENKITKIKLNKPGNAPK